MSEHAEDELAVVRRLKRENVALTRDNLNLKHGGGGGTSGPVEPAVPLKDYVDARDEAVESRLMAKLDTLSTKGTIWGAVATGTALLFAALAFGGDRFDSGMSASAVAEHIQTNQKTVDAAQNSRLKQMDDKLDILIQRSAKPGATPAN